MERVRRAAIREVLCLDKQHTLQGCWYQELPVIPNARAKDKKKLSCAIHLWTSALISPQDKWDLCPFCYCACTLRILVRQVTVLCSQNAVHPDPKSPLAVWSGLLFSSNTVENSSAPGSTCEVTGQIFVVVLVSWKLHDFHNQPYHW